MRLLLIIFPASTGDFSLCAQPLFFLLVALQRESTHFSYRYETSRLLPLLVPSSTHNRLCLVFSPPWLARYPLCPAPSLVRACRACWPGSLAFSAGGDGGSGRGIRQGLKRLFTLVLNTVCETF